MQDRLYFGSFCVRNHEMSAIVYDRCYHIVAIVVLLIFLRHIRNLTGIATKFVWKSIVANKDRYNYHKKIK